LFPHFYSDFAVWVVVQVCVFFCVKDSGILRDKMKYGVNKNYGTKGSDKKSLGSFSKYYTDITW
jgi:hypothetical protein